jgi:hypothetical protein
MERVLKVTKNARLNVQFKTAIKLFTKLISITWHKTMILRVVYHVGVDPVCLSVGRT